MTRRVAVDHYWRMKQAGFRPVLHQFSPDRTGWGVILDRECIKTVHAAELVERGKPETWTGLINAIRSGNH